MWSSGSSDLVHESGVEDAELLTTVAGLVCSTHEIVDDLTDVKQGVAIAHWYVLQTVIKSELL